MPAPLADHTAENAPTSPDPVSVLRGRFLEAIKRAFPALEGEVDPLITPGKQAELGDYQSNAAMGLSKRLGKNPRDVALAIIKHTDLGPLAEPLTEKSIAGPGFINITLRGGALSALLSAMDNPALGVPTTPHPQTVAVDLMGVNLAKQMHVGHLRSPIIGDAIARTLERLGHKVLRQNHVGDWGLPIAMVTARLMRLQKLGLITIDTLTLDDLDEAYKSAQAECQRDTAGLDAARRWGMGPKAIAELEAQVEGSTDAFQHARKVLVDLQRKEPATYAVWQKIYAVTMKVCIDVCAQLNIHVTDAHSAGESSYADEFAPMIDDLVARGIAVPDQGALIIKLDNPPDGFAAIKEPCLVRKTDGGFLYATTDIAAVRRRVQKLKAHRAVYAIDARQSLQLQQVFLASRIAGYATHPETRAPARLEHAAFGSILGSDGRPFKTRTGASVKLADVVQEIFDRAYDAVASRNAGVSESEKRATARAVAIAAIKYADLSTHRSKDVVFNLDTMLAFEGDTGPYLLNALVRIKSIFRKLAERAANEVNGTPLHAWNSASFAVTEPPEKRLALVLLRYASALASSADAIEPHRLAGYLHELAGAFASFYDQCPVLGAASPALRDQRLKLCDLTGRVLEDGLACLGIPPAERM